MDKTEDFTEDETKEMLSDKCTFSNGVVGCGVSSVYHLLYPKLEKARKDNGGKDFYKVLHPSFKLSEQAELKYSKKLFSLLSNPTTFDIMTALYQKGAEGLTLKAMEDMFSLSEADVLNHHLKPLSDMGLICLGEDSNCILPGTWADPISGVCFWMFATQPECCENERRHILSGPRPALFEILSDDINHVILTSLVQWGQVTRGDLQKYCGKCSPDTLKKRLDSLKKMSIIGISAGRNASINLNDNAICFLSLLYGIPQPPLNNLFNSLDSSRVDGRISLGCLKGEINV